MSNLAIDTLNNDRRALFASVASDKATMVSFHLHNNMKNITEIEQTCNRHMAMPNSNFVSNAFFTHSPPLLHHF